MYTGLQQHSVQTESESTPTPGGEDGDSCIGEGGQGNKVDRVCVSLREAMNEVGPNKYLLSIITTYVKMTEPRLETVLGIIKQLKGRKMSGLGCIMYVASVAVFIF